MGTFSGHDMTRTENNLKAVSPPRAKRRGEPGFTNSSRYERIACMTELSHYDYELPIELIAQRPLVTRSDARLLVVDRRSDSITHAHVRDFPDLLHPGDGLVLNDTRVVPARLVGVRSDTGGRWFGLYLESDGGGNWHLMSKTRGKLREGETVTLQDRAGHDELRLRMLKKFDDGTWAARPDSNEAAVEILERIGRVPLPHYIRDGEMEDADRETYQTVFAEQPGAVAAPTAGLHFTAQLLEQISNRGVAIAKVTLHVGMGTFRPISAQRVDEHVMHEEWGRVTADVADQLNQIKASQGRVVCVGTTVVRMLETAAGQGTLAPWEGKTDLFIRPPYEFHAVDALMTNFHLPKSSLLVLVRTFGGDDLMRRAYDEAIREEYRFFSYGDAMVIL